MVTQEQVLDALHCVIDPELGINVVDLGLVYSVAVQEDHVYVAITMTTPACPLGAYLQEMAEAMIRQHIPEVHSVEVELVWDPPWHPEMMSEAAQRQLGWVR